MILKVSGMLQTPFSTSRALHLVHAPPRHTFNIFLFDVSDPHLFQTLLGTECSEQHRPRCSEAYQLKLSRLPENTFAKCGFGQSKKNDKGVLSAEDEIKELASRS